MPIEPESPNLQTPYDQRGMTTRDREALNQTVQRDEKTIASNDHATVKRLEALVSKMQPFVDRMRTLHGTWPIKVDGDKISLQDNRGNATNQEGTVTFDVWENGVLVNWDALATNRRLIS